MFRIRKYSSLAVLVAGMLATGCTTSPTSVESDVPIEKVNIKTEISSLELAVEDLKSAWYHQGDTLKLNWTVSEEPSNGFEIHLSQDSGETYEPLTVEPLTPGSSSFPYVVPDSIKSERNLLKVVAGDGEQSKEAISTVFAINKYIIITSDITGETFDAEGSIELTWEADTVGITNGLSIEFSYDYGMTFFPRQFTEAVPNTETSYEVYFPTDSVDNLINSVGCYIKIQEYGVPQHYDIVGPFTVKPLDQSVKNFSYGPAM